MTVPRDQLPACGCYHEWHFSDFANASPRAELSRNSRNSASS
jgi:hypothetical protein